MNTYQQLAAATARRINSWGPDAPGVAKPFASHDKCETVTSMDDGDTGVIERNDDERLTITFDVDDRNRVTGWRYACYHDEDDLTSSDAYHTGGSTGSVEDIAWDITEYVTDWLDESFRPTRHTDNLELNALALTLEEDDFYSVSVERDEDGYSYLVVAHENDFSTHIKHDYSHDGIQRYLKSYKCEVLNPEGGWVFETYDDLDELRATLKRQEAIDPDEVRQEFVKQVDGLFDNDVWKLGDSWLSDMVAHWGPVDEDENEDRYRGKVNAMGIEEVYIGPFGQVEAVKMLAMGDFYGEETDVLRGDDLAWKAAAWLTEEIGSCGLDAHSR